MIDIGCTVWVQSKHTRNPNGAADRNKCSVLLGVQKVCES